MRTKAVRLYGKTIRLEEFDLPSIKDDEILAHIISDSACMSSYKAAIQAPITNGYPMISRKPDYVYEFCGDH